MEARLDIFLKPVLCFYLLNDIIHSEDIFLLPRSAQCIKYTEQSCH